MDWQLISEKKYWEPEVNSAILYFKNMVRIKTFSDHKNWEMFTNQWTSNEYSLGNTKGKGDLKWGKDAKKDYQKIINLCVHMDCINNNDKLVKNQNTRQK